MEPVKSNSVKQTKSDSSLDGTRETMLNNLRLDDLQDLTQALDRLSDKVNEGVEGMTGFLRGLVTEISSMFSR